MKKCGLMLLALLMTGCASTSYKGLPDGRANLDCSGVMRSWRSCEKRAGELCADSGYNILSVTAQKGPKDPGWSERLMAEYNAQRSMVIACKSGHLE